MMNEDKTCQGAQNNNPRVDINKMITKYEKEKQSKGLANLLRLDGNPDYVPTQNSDNLLLGEILRHVREGNSKLDEYFKNHKRALFSVENNKVFAAAVLFTFLLGIGVGKITFNGEKEIAVTNKSLKKQFRVTTKFVNLRAHNSPDAKKLLTISPAQELEVLKRKGGWAHVHYHNKLSGKKYSGYVWGEYLAGIK